MIKRNSRGVVIITPGARKTLEAFSLDVLKHWEEYWKLMPEHRYGKDFAAFLGERFLTDFDMRQVVERVRD